MGVLELHHLTKRFPGVTALADVSITLAGGEVHALVGENGAGKSTLIHILAGVYTPDQGTLLLDGAPIALRHPVQARRLGMVTVHQEAELFPTLSVAENMALGTGLPCRYGFVDWSRVWRQAAEIVAAAGESIDVRMPAARLRVGHRHMLQVAAAVVQQARFLILDEPTSALSAQESHWLFEQIHRLRAAGVGIVYVSHRQDEIFELADRITVLRDGRHVWTRPRADVDREALLQAMVGRESVRSAATGRSRQVGRRRLSEATPSRVPRLAVRGACDAEGAFRDISLAVTAGEIVGVYGLVGAGRSEWAQAMFGLRRLASGTVEVDGKVVTPANSGAAKQAGIAYVPEDRLRQALCRGLSVRANAALSSLAQVSRGGLVRRRWEHEHAASTLERLAVRARSIDQAIGELSGGNQQKVVVGRWMLTQPKVFLLDEPTRGVDVAAKAEMHALIRDLADQGCAVVMISSELPEVLEHSDRIIVFREGTIAAEFAAAEADAVQVAAAALPLGNTPGEFEGPRIAARSPKHLGRGVPGPSRRRARVPWSEAGLAVVLLALGGALATTAEPFATPANLMGVLSNAAVWTILALGAGAVILAGGIDISIGSLLGLSATAGALVLSLDGPKEVLVPLGIAVGLGVGCLGGLGNAGLSMLGGIHPIVVTLGTMTIYRGLLRTLFGSASMIGGMPDAFTRLARGTVVGVNGSAAIMMTVALGTWVWLSRTAAGRALYAYGSSPTAARQVGIGQRKVWLLAYGFGGLAASCAGLLELARNGSMQAMLGTGYELRAIAAAVVGGVAITGGRGTVPGIVLGALLLSLMQNALVLWQVPAHAYDLVVGGLLLGAILLDQTVRRLER